MVNLVFFHIFIIMWFPASVFVCFFDDNFGTAHYRVKWKVPSQWSSHDLSDAGKLVLISSLLRKWQQIEILKIWLPASFFFFFLTLTFEPLITVQNGSNIGKSLSRSIRRRTFGLVIFIINEMVADWNFENLTLASDFCRFLADNFGTAHHSAKWKIPLQRSSHDLSDADTFGLDIFIIEEMVTDWILTIWEPC